MPDVDGYQVAREIRRLEQGGQHIPIVAMTAYVLEGERERCLAAGMDDFLVKPLQPDALRAVLSRWVAAGWTRAPVRAKVG